MFGIKINNNYKFILLLLLIILIYIWQGWLITVASLLLGYFIFGIKIKSLIISIWSFIKKYWMILLLSLILILVYLKFGKYIFIICGAICIIFILGFNKNFKKLISDNEWLFTFLYMLVATLFGVFLAIYFNRSEQDDIEKKNVISYLIQGARDLEKTGNLAHTYNIYMMVDSLRSTSYKSSLNTLPEFFLTIIKFEPCIKHISRPIYSQYILFTKGLYEALQYSNDTSSPCYVRDKIRRNAFYYYQIYRLLALTNSEIRYQEDSISLKDLVGENNFIISRYLDTLHNADKYLEEEKFMQSIQYQGNLNNIPEIKTEQAH